MESQAGTTNMDSASGEQDKPGSALDTLMSSEGPSSLSQEGLLEHLRDEGTPRPVDTGSQALCVDNPLANMDSSTLTSALTSARSSAPGMLLYLRTDLLLSGCCGSGRMETCHE